MQKKRKHDEEHEADLLKQKYRPYDAISQAEDEQLTEILFGGATTFLKSLEEAEREELKSCPDSGVGEEDSDDCEISLKSVWTDDDDDGIEVGQALDAQGRKLPYGGINDPSNKYRALLEHKFLSTNKTPTWATFIERENSNDTEDILQSCGFMKNNQITYLPGSILEHKKMNDLNGATYSEGPYINSVEFLNNSNISLVAGQGGIATLFTVDGKKNEKLHSIGFENYPIFCAKLVENNNEAILGSRHSYIYSYDLIAAKYSKISLPPGLTTFKKFVVSPDQNLIGVIGKCGEIYLLSARSKERISILKQCHEVTALSFNPSSDSLYAHSNSGEITVFDVSMRRAKHKFLDDGCLQGSSITVSPSNQFLASGSSQGIVNIYDTSSIFETVNPKPRKTLKNMTTEIKSLVFNTTSEILSFSSVDVLNAVKFFHINSSSTFKNFPSFETRLGNISVVNFSPNSGYVALGNKKSTVSLYRLCHFKNY